MPRRTVLPLLAAAALAAGCGGSAKPVQLPAGPSSAAVYQGRTSQGATMKIEAGGRRAKATLRFELRCQDGSQTEATLTTEPKRPTLESDGSFYYSETGRANFRGFGDGRYRTAVSGQMAGDSGKGTAAFRISFKSTTCRASASWRVNHT